VYTAIYNEDNSNPKSNLDSESKFPLYCFKIWAKNIKLLAKQQHLPINTSVQGMQMTKTFLILELLFISGKHSNFFQKIATFSKN
jgi:hypothetical protein